jgi:cytosine/adenosine deaminase-related metal-dependent hydrolase
LYRKFSADKIFDGYQFVEQKVLLTDAAGVVKDIVDEKEAGDDVEKLNGIICPGFINAHCHLELSHMKGHIPKHTGLVDFVLKVVTERHFAEHDILEAIEDAEDEMQQNGIVAVGDICNNTLTIPQKNKGRLAYHNFIEASGFIPTLAKERFDKSLEILEEYITSDDGRRTTDNRQSTGSWGRSTITPHAPYSVSPEIFRMIDSLPNNNLLTIHNQETPAENEFFETGTGDFLRLYQQMGIDISFFKPTGKTSLQSWLPYFTKQQSLILVHNVTTSTQDIEFIKRATNNDKRATFLCLCPNANLYISNTLPYVNMLMKYSGNIVLGTDSLASNDRLSILAEIKTLQQNCKNLELETLLKWATSNGSKALQMHDKLGSFEKGKQPGVILIDGIEDLQVNMNSKIKRIL